MSFSASSISVQKRINCFFNSRLLFIIGARFHDAYKFIQLTVGRGRRELRLHGPKFIDQRRRAAFAARC